MPDTVPASFAAHPAKVLIVEDEPADLVLWRLAFRHSGVSAHVSFAQDGEEALTTLFDERHRFDMVLLDLNLPKVDGKQVLRALRDDSRFDSLPVIVSSSACSGGDAAACFRLGANRCLEKPASYPALIALVRELADTLPGE